MSAEYFILMLIAILVSSAIALGGLVLLFKQRVYQKKSDGHDIEIELPWFGKVKTNYPSVFAIVIGLSLVYVVIDQSNSYETIDVTGQITDSNGSSLEGITVGIIPNQNQSFTDINGRIFFKVLKSEGDVPYTFFAFKTDGTQKYFTISSVGRDNKFRGKLR